LAAILLLLALGCSDDIQQQPTSDDGTGSATGSGSGAGGSGASGPAGGGGGTDGPVGLRGSCYDTPPEGAPAPPPPPSYSGGTCPSLKPGSNSLPSGGVDRSFILVTPTDVDPNERLPLVFLWHWLGGDATGFLEQGDVQGAVDSYRFAAILPEAKGDMQFTWPMDVISSEPRIAEELTFFDDMLACASEQLSIASSCVASAGVSAGALFTDAVLAGSRGEYLSSIVSLSGGAGGAYIQPWTPPKHKMPAVVLWGGSSDNCLGLLSFESLSMGLEQELVDGGHFMLECIHNCGHAAPPFDAPAGDTPFAMMWRFIVDHPYWLSDGDSPYLDGLPPEIPEWCSVGAGSATPRQGECSDSQGC
jgi:predicted esterase